MNDTAEPSIRAAVLDATMVVIAARGVTGLRLDDVATEAGIDVADVAELYGDSARLAGAALDRFADEEIGRCDRILSRLGDPDHDDDDVVVALMEELERTFSRGDGGSIAQIELYMAAARDPALAATARRCIRAYVDMSERALIAGGLPRDRAQACARWVTAMVDGFGLHGIALGEPNYLPEDFPVALRALGSARFTPDTDAQP